MPIDLVFTASVSDGYPSVTAGSPANRAYPASLAATQMAPLTITGTGTCTVVVSNDGGGTFSSTSTGTFTSTFTTTGTASACTTSLSGLWFKPATGSQATINISAIVTDSTGKSSTIHTAPQMVPTAVVNSGTSSSTTVTMGGTTGSIQVTINSVQISAVVPFTTDLATTITNVVASINSTTSIPDYTASVVSGTQFKIIAPLGLGSAANNLTVSGIVTGNLTITGPALSGGVDRVVAPTTLTDTLLNGAVGLMPTLGAGLLAGVVLKNLSRAQVTVPVTSSTDKPTVAVIMQGMMIACPTGYTPPVKNVTTGVWAAATYPGSWDYSTFGVVQYTSNPAWCLLELIRNKRWGCGNNLAWMSTAQWTTLYTQLYACAQFCDQFVADGYGGQEPRFTTNVMINNMTKLDALQAMASVMNAQVLFTDNGVQVTQDRPRSIKRLVTNANVINGDFHVNTGSLASIFNYVEVQWNNPDKFYRKEYLAVIDEKSVNAIGQLSTRVAAFGCTSGGQARRLGRFTQLNESFLPLNITYSAGFDHSDMIPGDLIAVCDTSNQVYGQVNYGSFVRTVNSATSFVLDGSITDPGHTCYLYMTLPDGTVESKSVTSITSGAIGSAPTTNVVIASAYSQTPLTDAIWILTDTTDLYNQAFSIASLAEQDDGTYQVSGINYNPNKQTQIDTL